MFVSSVAIFCIALRVKIWSILKNSNNVRIKAEKSFFEKLVGPFYFFSVT